MEEEEERRRKEEGEERKKENGAGKKKKRTILSREKKGKARWALSSDHLLLVAISLAFYSTGVSILLPPPPSPSPAVGLNGMVASIKGMAHPRKLATNV